jgi:hypothetical protein
MIANFSGGEFEELTALQELYLVTPLYQNFFVFIEELFTYCEQGGSSL